jgi:hypothetical protein
MKTDAASESESTVSEPESGVAWNGADTRRAFLLKTGKAGAVTILSLHSFKVEVVAEQPSATANA